MSEPQLRRAVQYALERMERELSAQVCYHSVRHTRDEVVPGVEELARIEGIHGECMVLLTTAACFHDIGFTESRENHEAISARIAREVLPALDYSADQIEAICGMIMATKLPQSPKTVLEQILADADMRVLAHADFLQRNTDLRCELSGFGQDVPDEIWYRSQLKFLQSHRYFTSAARSTYEPGKLENIRAFQQLLDRLMEARQGESSILTGDRRGIDPDTGSTPDRRSRGRQGSGQLDTTSDVT